MLPHRTTIGPSLLAALSACAASGDDTGRIAAAARADAPADRLQAPAAGDPASDALLEGWQAETFELPPSFAPDMPRGSEALRFAPGWRTPAAEDFWSYACVLWIDEPAPDLRRVDELLEQYYDGLMTTLAGSAGRDISATPTEVDVLAAGPNRFDARIRLIDAFATFEPIELRARIASVPAADGPTALRIQISPQPAEHAIWRSLDAAIESILVHDRPRAAVGDPMASFARMVEGRWEMTTLAGTTTFDSWHWGPGRRSIRSMTTGPAPSGEPWHSMSVYYWHPGHAIVRTLGVSSAFRAVSEGEISFDGTRASGLFDLYQTLGHRKLGLRWTFDGFDEYHDELLEMGPEGTTLMNEWRRTRVPAAPAGERPAARATPITARPSEFQMPLAELLGRTWDGNAESNDGASSPTASVRTRTTLEYVPGADALYGRVDRTQAAGSPTHALDLYLYHHTGAGELRCLALSSAGAGDAVVYEGVATPIEGGRALEFDLQVHRADTVTALSVRLDFEPHGVVRQRVWSIDGETRVLTFDLHHRATHD